ncbi:hypothetical protein K227x_37330 [Rubripirellula lacrimiformis]|uniref:Uncharacterized protein n=1 Tax=Rubripirellula lacrimiformis TaxID=1930273 RepID=A0A517NDX5_9BACT|nr:hypothetical protein [Rubripirellula lacrimiformis]QDT05333.1 hypothetical protein K227x_37330 [Rubripirellula lacrimiformis]
MGRKPRRRMVHWVTFGFNDGSVIACAPERKLSSKRIKEERIYVCPDGVQREYMHKPNELCTWSLEQRIRSCDILSNRLNTRRAIRELVLPEIAALADTLQRIEKRLDAIERYIGDGEAS